MPISVLPEIFEGQNLEICCETNYVGCYVNALYRNSLYTVIRFIFVRKYFMLEIFV